MRLWSLWDYFPHPVDHPGWFFTVVFTLTGFIAGLCGDAQAMYAIFATGLMMYFFVRIANGLYHALSKSGWPGLASRLWLVGCIGWTCWFGLVYGEHPKPEEWKILLAPWIGGMVLYKAVRFILIGGNPDH